MKILILLIVIAFFSLVAASPQVCVNDLSLDKTICAYDGAQWDSSVNTTKFVFGATFNPGNSALSETATYLRHHNLEGVTGNDGHSEIGFYDFDIKSLLEIENTSITISMVALGTHLGGDPEQSMFGVCRTTLTPSPSDNNLALRVTLNSTDENCVTLWHAENSEWDGATIMINATFYQNQTANFRDSAGYNASDYDLGGRSWDNWYLAYKIAGGNDVSYTADFFSINYSYSPQVFFESPTPPTGSAHNTQQTINISCSSGNVFLWHDNLVIPATLVIDNQPSPASFTTSVTDDVYYYRAGCSVGGANTTVRNWTFDTTDPAITLNPLNEWNDLNESNNNQYDNLFNINITFSDERDLFAFEINITDGSTIMYNFTNSSISGTGYNFTNSIDISSWLPKTYNISVYVSDSHTAKSISRYNVLKVNNTLMFNTAEGNRIDIKADSDVVLGTTKQLDRYSFEFEYKDKKAKKRTFDVISANRIVYRNINGKKWFIVWNPKTKSGNWIDFEPYDIAVAKINDYHYKVLTGVIPSSVKFSSIGGLNVVNKRFSWYRGQSNITAPNTFEGLDITATINFSTANSISNIQSTLNYNGTLYSGPTKIIFGDFIYFSQEVTAPSVTPTTPENVTFFWNNTIFQTQGTNYSYITYGNQTVNPTGIDNCTNFTFPILNLTYFDEVLETAITLDNTYNLVFTGLFTTSVNGTFSGHESDSFCSYADPATDTFTWEVTGEMLLEKDEYATKLITWETGGGETATNNPITELPLYIIRLNESSTIIFTWLSYQYEPIDGAMVIYRCEGDGTRVFLESAAIINSQASVNLELINTPYSYEVVTGGRTYTDNNSYTKCHIEAETTRQFLVDTMQVDIVPFVGMYSIPCNVSKTGDNVVKVEWGINPESTATITGCMYALRHAVTGTTLVFTNCSTTSPMERSIPVSGFDYSVSGKLFQSGFSIECKDLVEFKSDTAAADMFGISGIIAIFFLISAVVLMFAESSRMAMGGAIIALVISFIFGFLAVGWTTIIGLVFFLIIIMIVGRHSKKT